MGKYMYSFKLFLLSLHSLCSLCARSSCILLIDCWLADIRIRHSFRFFFSPSPIEKLDENFRQKLSEKQRNENECEHSIPAYRSQPAAIVILTNNTNHKRLLQDLLRKKKVQISENVNNFIQTFQMMVRNNFFSIVEKISSGEKLLQINELRFYGLIIRLNNTTKILNLLHHLGILI